MLVDRNGQPHRNAGRSVPVQHPGQRGGRPVPITTQPVREISGVMTKETMDSLMVMHMPKIDAANAALDDALAGFATVLTRMFNIPTRIIGTQIDERSQKIIGLQFQRLDGQVGIVQIDRARLEQLMGDNDTAETASAAADSDAPPPAESETADAEDVVIDVVAE